MFDGVERGGTAAALGFRPARFSAVDAGSFGSGRRHKWLPDGSVTGGVQPGEARGGEVVEAEEYRGDSD